MKPWIVVIGGLVLLQFVSVPTQAADFWMHIHRGLSAEWVRLAEVDSLDFHTSDVGSGDVAIMPGTFLMGSPSTEAGRDETEVQHQVTLSTPYLMSNHEVTQAEWQAVMGTNPSQWLGDDQPVEQVTWYDCIAYCNRRSAIEGFDSVYVMSARSYSGIHITSAGTVTWDPMANGYRLPTEAEWEYGCRAGSAMPFCNGGITTPSSCSPLDPNLNLVGWYCGNAADPHDSGGKAPNAWNLQDMHGNVFEWCWDWFGSYSGTETDPLGPVSGSRRVWRGGSWASQPSACRSAYRGSYDVPGTWSNQTGLRVCRTIM
jgi:formylglycine-generating enzyme required for sulfatase activity